LPVTHRRPLQPVNGRLPCGNPIGDLGPLKICEITTQNDLRTDPVGTRALLRLLQPDKHKPLVVGLGGDLVTERNPIPVRVDVYLCGAPKLEIGHARTSSLGLNGDQPTGLGVLGEDIRRLGTTHRDRHNPPPVRTTLPQQSTLPAAPVITLVTCASAIAYSHHAADPRILILAERAAKFALAPGRMSPFAAGDTFLTGAGAAPAQGRLRLRVIIGTVAA
jgi:hypothetical protein